MVVSVEQEVREFRVTDLRLADENPRIHNIPALTASVRQFGFTSTPVVNTRRGTAFGDNTVIDGNGRVKVLREQGVEFVQCIAVDWDDERARGFLLAANRQGELGKIDERALAAQVERLRDTDALSAAGYGKGVVGDLLRRVRPTASEAVGQTAAEKKEIYDKGLTGRITITLPKGEGRNEFTDVSRRMDALMKKWGIKTSTSFFLWMLEEVEGAP